MANPWLTGFIFLFQNIFTLNPTQLWTITILKPAVTLFEYLSQQLDNYFAFIGDQKEFDY
jgi:hypothetical protein